MASNPDPDTALMLLAARAGSNAPIEQLYDRFAKSLFSYFCARLGDRELAKDLVQVVFERVIKYRRSFRGDSSFQTWMYRIARNVLVSHWKRESAGRRRDTEWFLSQEMDYDPRSLEMEEEAQAQLLATALDELPFDVKRLLIRAKLGETKYADIAKELGCSEGAVKARMFRAMKALRKQCLTHQSEDLK